MVQMLWKQNFMMYFFSAAIFVLKTICNLSVSIWQLKIGGLQPKLWNVQMT